MLRSGIPPPDALLSDALILLFDLAAEAGRKALAAHAASKKGQRSPRGLTRRPGAETPLWNEIRARLRRHLEPHGSKARLARELGLPRQRVTEYLRQGSSMPDAERTLMLLAWLLRQERDHPVLGEASNSISHPKTVT